MDTGKRRSPAQEENRASITDFVKDETDPAYRLAYSKSPFCSIDFVDAKHGLVFYHFLGFMPFQSIHGFFVDENRPIPELYMKYNHQNPPIGEREQFVGYLPTVEILEKAKEFCAVVNERCNELYVPLEQRVE